MSVLTADSEKPSDASHPPQADRRTRAMVSTKVGDPPQADRTRRRYAG